jgi:HK97 gp10 family phage protein
VAKRFKFEGLKELDRALAELPKATGKNAARRALKKAADPIDEEASAAAPFLSGRLERSVIAGTRLTRSQRSGGARLTASGFRSSAKNYVELHVGTALSRGIFMEFGTYKDDPEPFMRPAWEANKHEALDIIKAELRVEIDKAAARLARKVAKGA